MVALSEGIDHLTMAKSLNKTRLATKTSKKISFVVICIYLDMKGLEDWVCKHSIIFPYKSYGLISSKVG